MAKTYAVLIGAVLLIIGLLGFAKNNQICSGCTSITYTTLFTCYPG